jgi:hypothetical protein
MCLQLWVISVSRRIVTIIILSALLFSVIAVFAGGISAVGADPTPEPEVSFTYWDAPRGAITQSPTVIILSPQDKTYNTNNIILKVNVGSQDWVLNGVYYEADWREGARRIFNIQTSDSLKRTVSLTVNFTEVPDGSHNITVYANTHDGAYTSSSVFFTTNVSPPRITVLSIENKTYYTPELPLNFTVDESTSWRGYSLDGQDNASIAGNTTLKGLACGSHSLVVYANDTVGNMGTTGPIEFTIAKPETFPIVPVAVTVVAVVVISVGLVVHFKKLR